MPSRPAISILLPVHDAAETLPAAVDSLRAQTWQDWECLAVDDGSRDGSAGILERWAREDGRVRILHQRSRSGIVASLERARREARAPFLARQDADDRSRPDRLARQLALIASNGRLAAAGCTTAPAGPLGPGMKRYLGWLAGCLSPEACAREIWIESPLVHPSVLMRADAIDQAGGYRDLGWPEDYDLWLRLHRSGWELANLSDDLYEWADRPDRLTRTDPRYAAASFLRCKVHHLRRWMAERGLTRPLLIWGAGRDGRRLGAAWQRERERPGPPAPPIEAHIDIDPRKVGRARGGRPVLRPEEARDRHPGAFLLAAVGVAGARDQIRERLRAWGWVEGSDFLCLH